MSDHWPEDESLEATHEWIRDNVGDHAYAHFLADELDAALSEVERLRAASVLAEAAALVNGDRQAAYGHPADNHACTAALWRAYISRRMAAATLGMEPFYLDAYDVCMLNILQKVSRLAHSRTRDGLVDIAGFAQNADMVGE